MSPMSIGTCDSAEPTFLQFTIIFQGQWRGCACFIFVLPVVPNILSGGCAKPSKFYFFFLFVS